MGGPQVNGMQLLKAGQTDFFMGYDIQTMKGWEQVLEAVAVAAAFVDAAGCVICPGWVNTHHHLFHSRRREGPAGAAVASRCCGPLLERGASDNGLGQRPLLRPTVLRTWP